MVGKRVISSFDDPAIVPVVPHKAVAEVSRICHLQERSVVVMHGCQSELMDPKVVEALSFSLSLSTYISLNQNLFL